MNTPFPIEPQRPPCASGMVLPFPRVKPTLCEPSTYSVSITNPVRVRLGGTWWLLDRGYAVRADLHDYSGSYLDEATGEAANRLYLYRYVRGAHEAVRVVQTVRVDHHRRTAVCENGRRYPADIVLEVLLALAGHGSVAYAIFDANDIEAYRVHDCSGEVAAMTPWTTQDQLWFDNSE